jgi:hypothetical protein
LAQHLQHDRQILELNPTACFLIAPRSHAAYSMNFINASLFSTGVVSGLPKSALAPQRIRISKRLGPRELLSIWIAASTS